MVVEIRAGFKGGSGVPSPRLPTKPFICFSFVICACIAFLIFRLLQSPTSNPK